MYEKEFLNPDVDFSKLSLKDLHEAYQFFTAKADVAKHYLVLKEKAKRKCEEGDGSNE